MQRPWWKHWKGTGAANLRPDRGLVRGEACPAGMPSPTDRRDAAARPALASAADIVTAAAGPALRKHAPAGEAPRNAAAGHAPPPEAPATAPPGGEPARLAPPANEPRHAPPGDEPPPQEAPAAGGAAPAGGRFDLGAAIDAARGPGDLDPRLLAEILEGWDFVGRAEQMPPPGDWRTWVLLGGRGAGKTRAGAEWVQRLVETAPPERAGLRVALVAETLGDAREIMVDGPSGICRIARSMRPVFEVSRRRLVWPNGALAHVFSSEDPDSLRGPQFDFAWCDELAKWTHAEETWDMLQFGLRLGTRPRQLVTTTPRPLPLLKAILSAGETVATRMRTGDNVENLAPGFLAAMQARYGDTRLGRQELCGELIEDREDALWRRADLERIVLRRPGPVGRIVVAVDPPTAAAARNSCCGIVVAGLDASGRGVVLADGSLEGASPAAWGAAVVDLYRRFDADRVVAEVNQGGDMVGAILRSIDPAVPLAMVRATRGKWVRAEPVAALYEQGRVVHAGVFPDLEDQMCDFGPNGLSSGRSPDRLDALVWALTALMIATGGTPRVRGF